MMDVILVELKLLLDVISHLFSVVSSDGNRQKRKVGKELATIVISFDKILFRAEDILNHLSKISKTSNQQSFVYLSSEIKKQIFDIEKMVVSMEKMINTTTPKNAAKVAALYSNKDPSYFYGTIGLVYKEIGLFAVEDAINKLDTYKYLTASHDIKKRRASRQAKLAETLRITQLTLDLNNPRRVKEYIKSSRKNIARIKRQRNSLVKLVRENFKIEEIL